RSLATRNVKTGVRGGAERRSSNKTRDHRAKAGQTSEITFEPATPRLWRDRRRSSHHYLRYGVFVALAAISAILFAIRRARFFDRHQPDEISGRFLRQDAAEDRQGVRGHAQPGGRRNRESGREKNGRPLLAAQT